MIARIIRALIRFATLFFPSNLFGNSLRSKQTSLLRVLAMSHREQIDPKITVQNLAIEETGSYARRLQDFARWIAAKSSLSTALANTPGVLNDEDTLAVQCGIETGRLNETFDYLIRDSQDRGEHNAIRVFHRSAFYLLTTFTFTMLVVSSCLIFIVPTFQETFEEFGLELPASMIGIIRFANQFGWLVPLLLLLMIVAIGLSFSRDIRAALNRMPLVRDLPFTRRRRTAGLMRVLAVAMENEVPVGDVVTAAARHHSEMSCRKHLIAARSAAGDNEADLWNQLARQGLLGTNEATQLQRLKDPRVCGWALRAMADQERRTASRQSEWVAHALEYIPIVVIGMFVGWLVVAVMTTLTNLSLNLSLPVS